jgi:uncharacterized protein YndB with AHSA1/START domain
MPVPPHDQLQAVVRGLTTTHRDGQEMRLLTAERRYPAAPEEVWDALTNPLRVPRWLGGGVTGDLQLGGHFQVEGNAGGKILVCTPPTTLSLTWEYGGQISWVDVTLSLVDDETRLRLEHTAPVDPTMWDQFGPGAVGIGWEMALMGLDEHLLRPDADPAEFAAWMVTDEGKAYLLDCMTGINEAWAEQSIAAGTDPDQARAAAARCLAAYTAQPEESEGSED